MTQPLVSIIIPTYNDKNVVCDAIDCSLGQSYGNIEVVVVDDGSTDGTMLLLHEKYGATIRYIHQNNRGLSSARNHGIRSSSGKYIQFLDSDDLIGQDKIQLQVEQLEGTIGPRLAYCDYVRGYTDDAVAVRPGRMSPVLQKEHPLHDLIIKWETEISIPPHCFLFDASIFKEYGISFNESLPTHEDWECWMSVLSLNPRVVFVDRCLANYRIRRDSMCSNRKKMRDGYLMAIGMQISKNRANREMTRMLVKRKREVRYLYRDASDLNEIIERCHPILKGVCKAVIPWWVRKMLRERLVF